MDIDTAMQDKDDDVHLATELLRQDHAVVRDLFDQFQDAMDEDGSARQVIAQEICMQIELHSRIELEVFYPAVRDEDESFIDNAVEDHDEIASTIAEIRELPTTSDEYDDYIMELMDMVEEHVTEEEEVLFPELEERIPATLATLAEDIIAFKERVIGSTDDLEGPVTKNSDKCPSEAEVRAVMPKYTGVIMQTPPQFSAIKIAGERAYDLAREGETVEIPAREVEIGRLDIIEHGDGRTVFEMMMSSRQIGRAHV